jgi:hypothetical protein
MTRRTWIPLTIVLVLALLAGLGWGGHTIYVREFRGVPLIDEWHCSEGEAPVEAKGVSTGGYCAVLGTELAPDEQWEPLGNRPFSCDERWGWTVVVKGDVEDCLRDGEPLPEGWRVR